MPELTQPAKKQQVVAELGKPFFSSFLFTFLSQFTEICRDFYYGGSEPPKPSGVDAIPIARSPWDSGCLSLGVHVIVERQDCFPTFAAVTEQEVKMTVFKRITVRPEQMSGIPCIRGLRIPVATVVGMVSEGMAEAEILKAYPDLELEDIREALRYAAEAVRERELPVAGGS